MAGLFPRNLTENKKHFFPLFHKHIVTEKIDELVMRKIPQIVRAESASFIVPVYSSVSFQPPYEIHLPVNTVLV